MQVRRSGMIFLFVGPINRKSLWAKSLNLAWPASQIYKGGGLRLPRLIASPAHMLILNGFGLSRLGRQCVALPGPR